MTTRNADLDPRRAAASDWWKGAVIYEIYPLSFKDSNGDGLGDLPGIIESLDYVSSLGVDAIWVCPFFKTPMRDFGYDVADFCAVDPRFGTLDDVVRLIKKAHGLGLKVLFDIVACHTSSEHPWFLESRASRSSPESDWYVWADAQPDGSPPNNWLSIFGGVAWEWEPRRSQYYFHSFLVSQPALNLRCPETLEAILGIMRFWYDHGVDGFRLDAVTALAPDPDLRNNPPVPSNQPLPYVDGGTGNPFLRQEHLFDRDTPGVLPILRRFRELADRYDPPKFLMAEIGDVDGCVVGAKYAAPHLVHAPLIQDLTLSELSATQAATFLRRMVDTLGERWICMAFSSMDISRHVTRWRHLAGEDGDKDRLAVLLMGLLLTLRCCPCIYQGEELGLTEVDLPFEAIRDPWGLKFYPDYKGRDGCRTPFPWKADAPHAGFSSATPWLPLGADHAARAADIQDLNTGSVLNAYRRFIHWRKRHPALVSGSMQWLDAPTPLLAFTRSLGDERLLLVFNLSNQSVSWSPPERWRPSIEGHGLPSARLNGNILHFSGLDAWIGVAGA